MESNNSRIWRSLLVLGSIVFIAGSLQHPRGAMVDMLAEPIWRQGHLLVTLGIVMHLAGWIVFRRSVQASQGFGRWLLFAIVMTGLEAAEMAIHAFANVDAEALASGAPTPVLTFHVTLAFIVYTPFAVSMIGLILAGQRERVLGSHWIGWLGIFGAVAHGVVMWLVWILEIDGATILFPLSITLQLWILLAALWPVRSVDARSADTRPADARPAGATMT